MLLRSGKYSNSKNMDIDKVYDLIADLKKDNAEIKEELKKKASNDKIDELLEEIRKKDEKIVILQDKVAVLSKVVDKLKKDTEANEQYSRRTSLRITVPVKEATTPAEPVNFLADMQQRFVDAGVVIPDLAIDRVHPVTKPFTDDNGVKRRGLICKFTTWRHRTQVYRARKSFKDISIRLDLTKDRLNLLKAAQLLIKGNEQFLYAFADVNCNLGIRRRDESVFYFSSLHEVEELL